MQVLNANYTAFNDLNYKKMIFTFEIIDLDIVFCNDNSLTISGKTVKPYFFDLPVSISDEIDIINKQNTISEMEIHLQDFQNYVTQFMSSNSLLNKEIRIKQGFLGLAYTDYVIIYEGRILEYQYRVSSLSYYFAIGDRLRKLKNPLFGEFNLLYRTNKASLDYYNIDVVSPTLTTIIAGNITANAIDEADVTLTLDTGNSLLQGKILKITSGTLNGNYYYIDDQTDDNNIIISDQFPVGSEPSSDSFVIYDLTNFKLQGNVIDFLKYCFAIELSLISKTEYTALSLAYFDYDDETFDDLKTDYFSGIDIEYFVDETIKDSKKFFETEFFRAFQIYLFIDNEGHLKLDITRQPSLINEIVAFKDSDDVDNNIIGLPEYKTNADKIINQIYFKFDYDETSKEYAKKLLYVETESYNKYGAFPVLIIESKILKSTLNAEAILIQLKDRIFKRFANPTPEITIKTLSKYNYLEVGDVVAFSSNKLPNFEIGTKNMTALMEIIKKEKNYQNNYMEFTLFDTQYTGYSVVWASELEDITYANATETQRATLLFWTDENDEVTDENGNKIIPGGWSE